MEKSYFVKEVMSSIHVDRRHYGRFRHSIVLSLHTECRVSHEQPFERTLTDEVHRGVPRS